MSIPGLGCFLCGGLDHWAETCPTRIPPRNHKEHMARIAAYTEWCHGNSPQPGRIDPHQKHKLIEHENTMWQQVKRERKSA